MEIKKYNEFFNNENYVKPDIKKLMNDVEYDCGNKSDLNVIAEHNSYKEVVKNGVKSIPFIIEKINKNECQMIWFKAMSEITNNYTNICKYDNINNYWKKWAIENGY